MALHLAARDMRNKGPKEESHTFHKGDQVLLEATNLQTTHPKAKLAPKRYGPFKVLWASPTNCKLQLLLLRSSGLKVRRAQVTLQ